MHLFQFSTLSLKFSEASNRTTLVLQSWIINNFYLNLAQVWSTWSILIVSCRAFAVLLFLYCGTQSLVWSCKELKKPLENEQLLLKLPNEVEELSLFWVSLSFRSSLIVNQEFLRWKNLSCICIIWQKTPNIPKPNHLLKLGENLWVTLHCKLYLIFLIFTFLFLKLYRRVILSQRQDSRCWFFPPINTYNECFPKYRYSDSN